MKRALATGCLAACVSACALLTDLDGFSSGGVSDGTPDGASSSGTSGNPNGTSGGLTGDGGGTGGGSDDDDDDDDDTVEPQADPLLVVAGGRRDDLFVGPVLDTTYYATIRRDGTIGSWTPGPTLPKPYDTYTGVHSVNGAVHVLLGDETVSMRRTASGTLGPVQAEGAMPPRNDACGASSSSALLRFGGVSNDVAQTRVDAKIGASWADMSGLVQGRHWLGCAANDKFAYVVAGKDSAGVHQASIYFAPRTATGTGTWAATTSLPVTAYWARPVVVGPRLIVVGGNYDDAPTSRIYIATIAADGKLSPFTISSVSLPDSLSGAAVTVWRNRIYVSGGQTFDGTNYSLSRRVLVSTVDDAGALSPFQEATALPVATAKHGMAIASP